MPSRHGATPDNLGRWTCRGLDGARAGCSGPAYSFAGGCHRREGVGDQGAGVMPGHLDTGRTGRERWTTAGQQCDRECSVMPVLRPEPAEPA
jgi:hypothetical protein